MFILLFVLVGIIVYVQSFKEDFSKEKIQTISYALWVIIVVVVLYGILSSITKG